MMFQKALNELRQRRDQNTTSAGSSIQDRIQLAMAEQIEANRKAIEELRAEYDDHGHYADGPYDRTSGPK
jgi:hypothetical protein